MTTVLGSSTSSASRDVRARPDRGRKPSNTKRSVGSPEITSAVTAADGPGTTSTSIPASTHAATSRYPGSDSPGLPASVTTATFVPSRSRRTSSGTRSRSLPSNSDSNLASMPNAARSRPVLRVSSHATRSTEARVARARSERSPRLPMGVPTRNSVPTPSATPHYGSELGPDHRYPASHGHRAARASFLRPPQRRRRRTRPFGVGVHRGLGDHTQPGGAAEG